MPIIRKDRTGNLWKEGPIPADKAIRGFYSVTLAEEGYERTASVLTNELGFMATRHSGNRFRYEIPEFSPDMQGGEKGTRGANIVDVVCIPL